MVPEWLQAIKAYVTDKPAVQMAQWHLGLWKTLLTIVWEQRNVTLHSAESIVEKMERSQYTPDNQSSGNAKGTHN